MWRRWLWRRWLFVTAQLRRRPLASIVSKVHYEKQAVNRLSICIVFIVSMSQKQLIETTSPTIDLPNLFLK